MKQQKYLIYIHIGTTLPTSGDWSESYIYDSIYQVLLTNLDTLKIYVILNDNLLVEFRERLSNFNVDISQIEVIPISILELPNSYINYINTLPESTTQFRDSFWISTTARFFYIANFIQKFQLTNVFHIENDIMIYEDLSLLKLNTEEMYLVKDCESPVRVIPSIVYIPNYEKIQQLCDYIIDNLEPGTFLNDMDLLGKYADCVNQTLFFNEQFDGAAIGQYIGGIDPRNIPNFNNLTNNQQNIVSINNPTIGFINETAKFKCNDPNVHIFWRTILNTNTNTNENTNLMSSIKRLKVPFIKNEIYYGNEKNIINLHIHSKQLYMYSSIFDLKYNDIITGDRIISLCDFVITTDEIYNFHKNLEQYINIENIIIVKNFQNINIKALNHYFNEANKPIIKLFIYTHLLDYFIQYILEFLDDSLQYIIYLHNSDHPLTELQFNKLVNTKCIKKVYAQNIDCTFHKKFSILPIGLANSMWKHGDVLALYNTIRNTYYLSKTKNLYININPNTYSYRKDILNELESRNIESTLNADRVSGQGILNADRVSGQGTFNTDGLLFNITKASVPFKEYLTELSTHFFCLCVRGNGLATHREIESLYLGVIPVIINNKYTNMDNYVEYLKNIGLPFYEIKDNDLSKYSDDFFNEKLYKKIMKEHSMYNLPQLKLNYYNDTV